MALPSFFQTVQNSEIVRPDITPVSLREATPMLSWIFFPSTATRRNTVQHKMTMCADITPVFLGKETPTLSQVFCSSLFLQFYSPISNHTFLDGYCSTVQGLLDWFEVDLGFTELSFIRQSQIALT